LIATAGVVSEVSGAHRYDEPAIPEGVKVVYTYVSTVHEGAYKPSMPKQPEDKDEVMGYSDWVKESVGYLGGMLERGEISAHQYRAVPGDLDDDGEGLRKLKRGEAKERKFIYRVVEGYGGPRIWR